MKYKTAKKITDTNLIQCGTRLVDKDGNVRKVLERSNNRVLLTHKNSEEKGCIRLISEITNDRII